MKREETLIVAGVLSFCVLIGVAVSNAVPSVFKSVQLKQVEAQEKEELAAGKIILGRELRAGYRENLEINDEMLAKLLCNEGQSDAKSCYHGPNLTEERLYYGKADVVLQGKTIPVQLTSSYGSTYLEMFQYSQK